MSAGGGEDFSTGAELSLTVPDSELSAVRSQIERELADIEIGVSATVSGGGGMQPRDPATGQFRAIEGVEQRVIEQTQTQVEVLNDIKDELEGGFGGVGGGGGGSQNVLNAFGLGGVVGRASGALGGGGAAAGAAGSVATALGVTGGAALGAGELAKQLLGAEVSGGPAPSQRQVELTNVPEPWPPKLQVPPWLQDLSLDVPRGVEQLLSGGGGGPTRGGPSEALLTAARSPADTTGGLPGQGRQLRLGPGEERMIEAAAARAGGGGSEMSANVNFAPAIDISLAGLDISGLADDLQSSIVNSRQFQNQLQRAVDDAVSDLEDRFAGVL